MMGGYAFRPGWKVTRYTPSASLQSISNMSMNMKSCFHNKPPSPPGFQTLLPHASRVNIYTSPSSPQQRLSILS